jgi:hypothetical protein
MTSMKTCFHCLYVAIKMEIKKSWLQICVLMYSYVTEVNFSGNYD